MGGSSSAAPKFNTIRLGSAITKDLAVNKLFRALIEVNGSDLHLQVGKPAIIRVRGTLKPLDMPPIDEEQMKELIFPMMDGNKDIFLTTGRADYATSSNTRRCLAVPRQSVHPDGPKRFVSRKSNSSPTSGLYLRRS
jgi:hypothetical protein